MRSLPADVAAALAAGITTPTLLVDHSITSANAHHSTRGDVVLDDGTLYLGGMLDVLSIDGYRTGTLRLRNTDGALTASILAGEWRNSAITMRSAYLITDGYVDPDYVDPDYVSDTVVLVEDFMSAVATGCAGVHPWIEISYKRVESALVYLPSVRYAPRPGAFNRLPTPGAHGTFNGADYTIPQRRTA